MSQQHTHYSPHYCATVMVYYYVQHEQTTRYPKGGGGRELCDILVLSGKLLTCCYNTTMTHFCIDPNQSHDFHPTVQLIWLADKVGWQYKIIVSATNICSRTMLLQSTVINKRLCFAMII